MFIDDGQEAVLTLEACAPALRATRQHVRVMEEPVRHRGDGRGVAEELAPILDGTVRGQQRRRALVAPHDDSRRSSAAGCGSLRIPRSSMMSRGTVVMCAT
jgi:hypothetical protein